MIDSMRNRCDPASLTEELVDAAVERIGARDGERGRDARHIYDTLTWGEGPGMLSQSGLQDWLWYRLATKYLTDEVGYMGRLAGLAAELFDELGLDLYAAICRSEVTVGVHAAFDRSRNAGFAAMGKARNASGIDPPALDDFEWGDIMGVEEANARTAAGAALEATALMLVERDEPVLAEEVANRAAGFAVELGWRATGDDGINRAPSARDVGWALRDAAAMLRLFGMLDEQGEWRERRWLLTPAGVATMLGILRHSATGPRSRP